MAKVMIINGLWSLMVCGMLASTFFLFNQKTGEPLHNQYQFDAAHTLAAR